MKKFRRNKKIGLALSGGAALGAAHIGVLKAFKEMQIDIACISGTSIGAFVAAFYANGMDWEEIGKIAEDIKWLDLSGISLSGLGLLSNEKMGKLIEEQLGKRNLEEGNIPIALIATDICSGEKVVMKTGSVADAVMASTCIPGVFTPVEINGRMLVDGGIVENVPISPLKEMGADVIIAVDLNAANKPRKPGNIVEVLLRTFDFLIQSISIVQKEKADIRIEPDLSEYNMVEIKQAPDLILEGYHAAMIVLRKTLRAK